MSTCPSCGGVIGLDCFNPQECAEITGQMMQQTQACPTCCELQAEIERLRSELADRDKFVANDVRYCESRARRAAGVASNDTRSFGQLMDVVDEKIREQAAEIDRLQNALETERGHRAADRLEGRAEIERLQRELFECTRAGRIITTMLGRLAGAIPGVRYRHKEARELFEHACREWPWCTPCEVAEKGVSDE